VSSVAVISNLADTIERSYLEICTLQRCQYLSSEKWQLHLHSSHRYTPSAGVNNDPGIVRTVSDLIGVSSSVVTQFKSRVVPSWKTVACMLFELAAA
jgi:hypothetical protein